MSVVVKIDNVEIDLYPDFDISFGLDMYDTEDPSKIRVPFSFANKFPYTTLNKDRFNYDYSVSRKNLQITPLDYEILYNGVRISYGNAFVDGVYVNSEEPYFDIRFEDAVSNFGNKLKELEMSDLYGDAFGITSNTLNTFLASRQNYGNRTLEIPFIDYDNIQSVTGYESRQFTSWGLEDNRYLLQPAIQVKNFFERIFSNLGFTFSSMFASGSVGATYRANDLYFLYPTHLVENNQDKRLVRLEPYPYNVTRNDDQENDGDTDTYGATQLAIHNYKIALTELYGTFGPTNYYLPTGPSDVFQNTEYEYGNELATATDVIAEGDVNIGYAAFGSGFDGYVSFNSGTSVTVSGLKTAIVSTYYANDTADIDAPGVINITSVNTAKFTPYIAIYDSFYVGDSPTYKIPMRDVSGNILKLTPTIGTTATMDKPFMTREVTIFGPDQEFTREILLPGNVSANNTLNFANFTAYLDTNEIYRFRGGTRYSVGVLLEMSEGNLSCNYYKEYDTNTTIIPPTVSFVAKNPVAIALTDKLISKQRVYGYPYGTLKIKINSKGYLAATCPSDTFKIKDSFVNSQGIKPYDIFIDLLKRFNLSIFYDYDANKFVVDRTEDLRTSPFFIDQYIDDLVEFQITAPSLRYKSITLKNKEEGGYYDVHKETEMAVGSTTQAFDAIGKEELEVNFITSLIDPTTKTICGEPIYMDPEELANNLLAVEETGYIKNQILEFDKVGLRLFYLRTHTAPTVIRFPTFRKFNRYGQDIEQIVYEELGTYFLGGYPVITHPTLGQDLRFGDRYNNVFLEAQILYGNYFNRVTSDGGVVEGGSCVESGLFLLGARDTFNYDAYTKYISSEKFKSASGTAMTFYAALPLSFIEDMHYAYRKFRFGDTNEEFVITNISDGKIYDNYLYSKLDIKFL